MNCWSLGSYILDEGAPGPAMPLLHDSAAHRSDTVACESGSGYGVVGIYLHMKNGALFLILIFLLTLMLLWEVFAYASLEFMPKFCLKKQRRQSQG